MKKKTGKIIGIAVLILFCMLVGYLFYLQVTYSRIEDYTEVTVYSSAQNDMMQTQQTYSLISFNIGFGAYSDDYSFFMDGGKYSRAYNKEAVLENITTDIDVIKTYDPDIILLQETDLDSTRSYHVDQVELITQSLPAYAYNFALNYHSAYLLYPLYEPHGASNAGLLTMSKFQMDSAVRRSLPISTSLFKFIDLDRCYVTTRIPTDNGKELVLYNVHLSAYTVEDDIVSHQIEMLASDMKKELEQGNYIICGGDFNQDMLGNSPEVFQTDANGNSWASPFPVEKLPEGFSTMTQRMETEEINQLAPSCRNADAPYVAGESYVTFVDGFILSDNVEMLSFETIDQGFSTSDHNPICMEIKLK